jgi:hypothetical protein
MSEQPGGHARIVEQPEPAPKVTPPAPPSPPVPDPPGKVTLYAIPPMGTMTVPPLDPGGEPVVITRYGTVVDTATARRAHEAAAASGFAIREA